MSYRGVVEQNKLVSHCVSSNNFYGVWKQTGAYVGQTTK